MRRYGHLGIAIFLQPKTSVYFVCQSDRSEDKCDFGGVAAKGLHKVAKMFEWLLVFAAFVSTVNIDANPDMLPDDMYQICFRHIALHQIITLQVKNTPLARMVRVTETRKLQTRISWRCIPCILRRSRDFNLWRHDRAMLLSVRACLTPMFIVGTPHTFHAEKRRGQSSTFNYAADVASSVSVKPEGRESPDHRE